MTHFPRRLLLGCLLMSSGAPGLHAAVQLASDPGISLSGFGTLGLTHNSTGGAEFVRDFLQPDGVADGWSADVDSRFGLQLNARLSPEVEAVVQAVTKYSDEGNYSPELTWAFASYEPDPNLRFRAGRLGWDIYLLSDSRDIGYSYLWVRPPPDFFGTLLLSHIDGGDAVFKHDFMGGLVSAKIYGGLVNQKVPATIGPALDLGGSTMVGGNLSFRKGDWLFRAGYAVAGLDKELPSLVPLLGALEATGSPMAIAIADDLGLKGASIDVLSAGSAWEHGPWQAQLMYSNLSSSSLSIATANSGYFMLGYRRGKWSPYFTAAGTVSKEKHPQTGFPLPNPLDTAVAAILAQAQSTQHTLTVGLRYDFMSNADVKVQLDRIHVYDNAAAFWRHPKPDWDGDATIFSLTLDFVF